MEPEHVVANKEQFISLNDNFYLIIITLKIGNGLCYGTEA